MSQHNHQSKVLAIGVSPQLNNGLKEIIQCRSFKDVRTLQNQRNRSAESGDWTRNWAGKASKRVRRSDEW